MGLLTSASFLAKKDLLSQYSIVFMLLPLTWLSYAILPLFYSLHDVADMLRYSKPLFGERRVNVSRMPP